MDIDTQTLQWLLIIGSSLVLFLLSPFAKTTAAFYEGKKTDKGVNAFVLTSSLVISWLFAKSLTNAANLGLSFGIVGGVAYAAYYLSFIVAGIVIYKLRVEGGFKSIHHFLESKFGKGALVLFTLLIVFRLFNEVWSNTMVIGSYFGENGSIGYWSSIIVFTLLTLAYSLKGGMSSSLVTDLIQMVFFGVLILLVFFVLFRSDTRSPVEYISSGTWSLSTGVNLLLVALIQCLSYPFHDPVMTDRGFITDPKTTLKSFLWAAPIGAVCIVLFSFVGIFGSFNGVTGQAAVGFATLLGVPMMLIINFIMITSAASTIDSTFSSFAKLVNRDLQVVKNPSVRTGRIAMIAICVLGTIPIFLNAEILSATTISGTMVIGLAPVFLFWKQARGEWAFYLPVVCGLVFGIILTLGLFPQSWYFSSGKYNDLLSVNVIGTICCFTLFFIGNIIHGKRNI